MNQDKVREDVAEILDEEEVLRRIEKNKEEAQELLKDKDKMDRFLERLEKKLKHVPLVGKYLAELPVFVSLVKAYVEKRYQDIPIGSIIAIICALIYFLSAIDLIPDVLPVIGLADDAAVVALTFKLVHDDVVEYKSWRDGVKPA